MAAVKKKKLKFISSVTAEGYQCCQQTQTLLQITYTFVTNVKPLKLVLSSVKDVKWERNSLPVYVSNR